MNEIEKIAAEYFQRFESILLYPSPKTRDFWIAAAGVVVFLSGLVWYSKHGTRAGEDNAGAFLVILVADGALIGSGALVKQFHKAATLELANRGRGSNLQTVEAAKAATLCRFLNCRSFEFLHVAEDIQRLAALRAASGAPDKTSGTWLERVWFDEGSKSRLMSILLSVLAVLVTLLATNPAIQDQFFDAIGDEGVWELVAFLEFLALFLVSVLWGTRWLVRAAANFAVRWSLKVSNSRWAIRRKVDYLIQDLVRFHRMRPMRLERGPGGAGDGPQSS